MRIVESAHRHGIADEDIWHAFRNPMAHWQVEDNITLLIGPARNTDLLEIGVLELSTDSRIIHAMPARRKYLP
jgi:hypothetical protein